MARVLLTFARVNCPRFQRAGGLFQPKRGQAMAKTPLPTQDILQQLFRYNSRTGVLKWKRRPLRLANGQTEFSRARGCKIWNAKYAGKEAGCVDRTGYRSVKIFDRPIHAHRIIWCLMHGEWPDCINHINGNLLDNRIGNLRSLTRQQCQRNQRMHKTNTSGRTGVSWNKFTRKWVALIKMNDVSHYLGSFDLFRDAVAARSAAETEHGFTGRR